MKSPNELSAKLAKQWHNADIRERRLLYEKWPIKIAIGKPGARIMAEQPGVIREHLTCWRNVTVGTVHWSNENYRDTNSAVAIPKYWQLNNPSEWIRACADSNIEQEFRHLGRIVEKTDSLFHPLIIRQRSQVMARSAEDVIRITETVMALQPGCAKGKPLRALSINRCDSKFFERNRHFVIQMLALRFGDVVEEAGLEVFLDALDEHDHWLLVAPLAKGLLPFDQQRVRTSELMKTALPDSHILVVENERSLYQLPSLPRVIAILGAGLNLSWLTSDRLSSRELAYWGDIDTWGLKMLAKARECHPQITPLMMDRATFDNNEKRAAVAEPVVAGDNPPSGLNTEEQQLYQYLLSKKNGRLEQEFIPADWVKHAVEDWISIIK